MKKQFLLSLALLVSATAQAQMPPWQNPLRLAWSTDGANFDSNEIFQDSSGVPSMIHWKGDTLICAFQWFRLPQNSPTWDRVAVKFSYDAGQSWTTPTPIVVNGLPANFQRPFDPTLALFSGDSLRMYFSSSEGLPMGGLDEKVNCYSAKSSDGIHYTFEPNARVDHPSKPLIDPAVIYFKNSWHYTAPSGAPQDGAHHQVSPNGLVFSAVANIPSDNQHNWTGNFMINNADELRFYGSGPSIWYNTTANGGQWNGFVATNVQGGDPTVVRLAANQYLMVYVGKPYTSAVDELGQNKRNPHLFPNPADTFLALDSTEIGRDYAIFNSAGQRMQAGILASPRIDLAWMPNGIYALKVSEEAYCRFYQFVILH